MRRTSRADEPTRLRLIAVLTTLAFGCATVRVPASTIPPTVSARGGIADPEIELWLESGREVSPAESARAEAQAREALRSALAGVAAPEGDAVLVVRAQGVARTASRRSDQRAAIAGIVVGAVVIVAVVVAALVASKGKGGAPRLASAKAVPHRVPAPHPPLPHVPAPRASPPRVPAPRLPAPAPIAHHGAGAPHVDVDLFVGIDGSQQPNPAAGEPLAPDPGAEAAWAPTAPATADDVVEIALPQPEPLRVEERGFFAKDRLRLELLVVDRWTGVPLWTKGVEGDVDPCDARAVQELLGRALADAAGWAPGAGGEPFPAAQ